MVPWGSGEVDAWAAAAAQPKLLGPAVRLEPSSGLDPIVVEGLKTLTHSVNMANDLAGHWTAATPSLYCARLKDGGYRLPADSVCSWAIANGWPARAAERLRSLAADFEAGKRPRLQGGYPLRSDILDVWRQEASQA